MTIPQDSSICFTIGHILALAGKDAILENIEKEAEVGRRSRLLIGTVIIPIGAYFWKKWPEWSWMYLLKKRSRSLPIAVLAFSGYFTAFELGFKNASRLIKDGRTDEAVIHSIASLSALAVVSSLGWQRFRWRGTREEYEAGTAKDFLTDRRFLASILVSAALAGSATAVAAFKNVRCPTDG